MKAAGIEPKHTVMVGDGLPDMGAARRAGVQAIACGYGYCSVDRLIQAGAAHVIQSPFELESLLKEI
jgi:phosphoglycolate phosphatase